MPLTIILPTRARPALVCETLRRTLPNIARDDTRLILAFDADDAPIDGLPEDPRLITDVREREDNVGDKWNRAYRHYPDDLYMIVSDYTAVVTPGFDQKMLDAAALFPDGVGAVYGRMANQSFPCTMGITHKLCDKLGWMFPPYFPFWFVDHWLDDIVRLIDRISFADVELVWPAKKEPTHEFREVSFWATFFDAMRIVRREQARVIIDSPGFVEPEWRKEALRNHYPLIEHRSQSINNMVRSWRAPDLAGPPDERYTKLKQAAVHMMRDEWPRLKGELGK